MAEEQQNTSKKVRGKAKLLFLGRTQVGKLPATFRTGVVTGENSKELSAFAGRLGRDPVLLPFTSKRWPDVAAADKTRVMQEIKQHFDFPDEYDKCVLKQLNAPWKDEKGDLKRKYFKSFTSTAERLANCPEKFPEDQWTLLVEHWEKREVDEIARKNTNNRNKLAIVHSGGSKSFVKHAIEIEADTEREAPSGTPATRIEIFKKTHIYSKRYDTNQ